jgi:PAS domain-containing protein
MEGFVAYDRDWHMTYINGSGERLLGRRRAEVLGKKCLGEKGARHLFLS